MKKNKMYYSFKVKGLIEGSEEEKDLVSKFFDIKGTKSSKWFTSLPTNTSESLVGKYISSIPNLIKYIQKICLKEKGKHSLCKVLNSGRTFSTARTCPGVRSVLSNSIVVKSPCDIIITVDEAGNWVYTSASNKLVTLTEDHGPEQFGAPFNSKDRSLFVDKRVIKINLPVQLATDNIPYIHLNPQFHSNTPPLEVITGVISGAYTRSASLNIITMYTLPPKGETLEIVINSGDVLAYLWSPEPLVLAQKKRKIELFDTLHNKFIGSYINQ